MAALSVTLAVGEPLGNVSGSSNHDFRTSVSGIFDEIDASFFHMWPFVWEVLRWVIRRFALVQGCLACFGFVWHRCLYTLFGIFCSAVPGNPG